MSAVAQSALPQWPHKPKSGNPGSSPSPTLLTLPPFRLQFMKSAPIGVLDSVRPGYIILRRTVSASPMKVVTEQRQEPQQRQGAISAMSRRAAGIAPDKSGGCRLHQPVTGLLQDFQFQRLGAFLLCRM